MTPKRHYTTSTSCPCSSPRISVFHLGLLLTSFPSLYNTNNTTLTVKYMHRRSLRRMVGVSITHSNSQKVTFLGRSIPVAPFAVSLAVMLVFLVFRSHNVGHNVEHDETLYGLPRTESRFLVKPKDFVEAPPRRLHLPDMPPMPEPLPPKKKGMRIPNSVHYVYGLKPPDEGKTGPELPYYAYLAMRSAIMHLKPEKMYL